MSAELATGAVSWLRRLGAAVTGAIAKLGYASRFLIMVLVLSPHAFRRLHLTLREIYFAGVLSLVIILMSGLFVGMVLSLQGYEVLVRYGADEQLVRNRIENRAELAPLFVAARDVAVDGVKRDAAHRDAAAVGVLRSRGQRDLERARGDERVLVEDLVEVAHPEQQDGIAMLLLRVEVLTHRGRRGR